MKRIILTWLPRAERDLEQIRARIARDKPIAAEKFIKNLRKSVGRLRRFPYSGWMVEEWQDPRIREILYGPYRIIHRVRDNLVQIMIVIHGARLLDEEPWKD